MYVCSFNDCYFLFFFFKQKTAYEMRISDWSSDVCSSYLAAMRDLVIERSHEIRAADREAQRLAVVARRIRADRIADPSFGVRLFSERGGMEQGAGIVIDRKSVV